MAPNLHIPIIIAAAYLGGWLSRWHGGGMFEAPKVIKNITWALPLTAIACYVSGWWGLLGLLCIAKGTGHGRVWNPFIPLDTTKTPEKLEWPILWLHGKIPDFSYKVIALSLIGLAATLGAAIAIGITSPAAGALCALGGALKPVGYVVGWVFWPDNHKSYATRTGEWGGGIPAYGLTAVGVFLYV